ncbi:MAG: hypothetical protein NTZ32_07520 [Planctomycetales bacterium]|nr:hypothetical protein [Planctomycetales bacterium]
MLCLILDAELDYRMVACDAVDVEFDRSLSGRWQWTGTGTNRSATSEIKSQSAVAA